VIVAVELARVPVANRHGELSTVIDTVMARAD